MKIRPIKKNDLNKLHDFFSLVISDISKKEGIWTESFVKDEVIMKTDLCKAALDNNEDFYVLVIEKSNKIIGTISSSPCNLDIIKIVGNLAKGKTEIGSIYVHPNFQNQGVAKKLLNKMVNHLRRNAINSYYLDCGYSTSQLIWKYCFGKPTYLSKNYWGENNHHMVWHIDI